MRFIPGAQQTQSTSNQTGKVKTNINNKSQMIFEAGTHTTVFWLFKPHLC